VSAENKTVAVVITTYNHAHFLLDALHSVLDQTRPADEILVVDDGSGDDPAAVVAQCPGVKLLRQDNQGLATARNAGLNAVHCDKVIFLDADDRLLPEAVAAGLACFAGASAACGFVYGAHRHIDRHGHAIDETCFSAVGAEPYRDLLRGNLIGMHAAVMYERARLLDSGGFDPAWKRCEDYDIYLRMARDGPIACHPRLVAEYRRHGANMSSNHREMLDWALRVHGRHAEAARALGAAASDWAQGQRAWRSYYARQILSDTRQRWVAQPSLREAVRGVLRAVIASPPAATKALAQTARNRLGHGAAASTRSAP
jgi:glycosyltransferase involved in cell wall biosynthesis